MMLCSKDSFRRGVKANLPVFAVALALVMLLSSAAWAARVIDENEPTKAIKSAPASVAAVPEKKPAAAEKNAKPAAEPVKPQKKADETQYVTMDFDEVDIKVLIKFVADVTGRNFIIGDRVKGKVTVISPRKMTLDEAYNVFLSVLNVNGYSTVPMGNVIKVVKSSSAVTDSLDTMVAAPTIKQDKMVTQIIQLKHAEANDIRTPMTPLMSKGTSQILAYPQSNVLIVTDNLSNIKKIMDILNVIDVPGFAQEVQIITLSYASATDLSGKLSQILSADAGSTTAKRTTRTIQLAAKAPAKIMPYERTNSLIVMASAQDMEEILDLVERLDVPTPSGKEGIQVYYLQYANAEDLAKVLSDMPTPVADNAAATKAKTAASSGDKNFKIAADKETNSLIIYADPDTYNGLVETIKYLDIPRKQVYVRALIMEVKTDKDFKVGVEWNAFEDFVYDSGKRIGGVVARTGANFATDLAGLPSGPLLGFVGEQITIGSGDTQLTFPNMTSFINAMEQDSDVNIISTPQIITLDNKEAEIKVGANVPYVTREDTDSTNINRTVRTYDYRDVGVTLKITPQINQEGSVRMDIFQEITTLVSGQGQDQYAPTTLKRSANTTVTVKDRTTMVIGGLIGENMNYGEYRVPGLGRIPGLGWMFKSRAKTKEKTNLYIFLTPMVIESDHQTEELYQLKYGEIKKRQEELDSLYNKKKKKKEKKSKKEEKDQVDADSES